MGQEPPSREDAPSWNLSQERVHLENLFCQRFNFFIVLFSLVVAGAANANTQVKLAALLWIGFFLCALISLTIYRNYVKLMWIFQSLHQIPTHPIARAGVAAKQLGWRGLFGVNSIIGIIIPSICCTVLLVGAILASACYLKAA